jgi:hypothetical protein
MKGAKLESFADAVKPMAVSIATDKASLPTLEGNIFALPIPKASMSERILFQSKTVKAIVFEFSTYLIQIVIIFWRKIAKQKVPTTRVANCCKSQA